MKTFCLLLILILCFFPFYLIDAKRPFTVKDLHMMKRVSGGSTNPSGTLMVYSLYTWNPDTGKKTTYLELLDLRTQERKKLLETSEGITDYNPVFVNDDVIFFLSTRSGIVNVWMTNLRGTGAQQLSNYPVDIDNLKIAPNRRFFTFTAEVFVDCPAVEPTKFVLDCTAARNKEFDSRAPNTWRKFTRTMIRHWDRYEVEGRYSHIFHQAMNPTAVGYELVGLPVDIMQGMLVRSPVYPDGGPEQYDIAPNSDEIAFTGEIIDYKSAWYTGWKIFISKVTATPEAPIVLNYTDARIQDPLYSPDGKYIAYLAMPRPRLESDILNLYLLDRQTKNIIPISNNFDRTFMEKIWTQDSSSLLFTATDFGYNKVFMININDKSVVPLISNYKNGGMMHVSGNSWILKRERYSDPSDFWTFQLNVATKTLTNLSQITSFNQDLISQIYFPKWEQFYFKGGNNTDMVQGWFIYPYSYTEGTTKKYPMAHIIHGGPEGAWEEDFHYRWNPMLWAAQDYAVVMINPHGSSGMGQKFVDAVRNNWGGLPFKDLMLGLDYAIENYPFVDGNRVGACGASYGGYMINWLNGNTDRYKCLTVHDGVFDTMAMGYETEELWFPLAEYGGNSFAPPYVDPSGYEKWNPRNFVQNWKTPCFVIHGGIDFRIPFAQGAAAFSALNMRGIPTQMLVFEHEDHFVLRPENSIKWYTEVLDWLDRWTKN